MARKTWSTWYNQPTAQIYHVAADNRFPYWLYGAQQDSGGVGVSTWSRQGVLTFRNWEPTCLAGESNTVIPDPKDGNILYGSGAGRCDQALNIAASLGGQLPPPDPERSQPQNLDAAAGLLAGRRSALLRQSVRHALARSRPHLGEDQPRSCAR